MDKPNLEFISYTGTYPNLCRGELTIKIDGKEVTFGPEWLHCNYPPFWCSGGAVTFDNHWDECVTQGDWELNENDLPDELKHLGQMLIDLFNANVKKGCCGGCV